MKYMSEKTFKVVRMSEAYRVTGKGLLSTKWGGTHQVCDITTSDDIGDGRERKTLYIDVKKAQLVPKCTTFLRGVAC